MSTDAVPSRRLLWDACYNVRDLGGYPTTAGRHTSWNAFIRSDNLCRLTPGGRAMLVNYGVRTVIDLRFAYELDISPYSFTEPDAPAYLNLPLLNEANREGMVALDSITSVAEMYYVILEQFQTNIATVMRAIAAAPEGAVLFHCHAGKDRAGLMAALLLALAGVPHEAIATDYAESDTHLQPLYDEMLASQAQDPARQEQLAQLLTSHSETMLATLSHVDARYGGVESYLLACGLSPEEIEQIRTRFLA
jgi:protein-tyrosine phosphatase